MTPERLEEIARIRDCAPFACPEAPGSVEETQRAIDDLLAEIVALNARAEKAEAEAADLRAQIASGDNRYGRDYCAETEALLAAKDARIAADYDAMKTRAEKAEARACRYESFFRLIANRCEFPAPPNAICWHNPAELARDALAEPQGGMTYQDPIDRTKGHDTGGER